MCQTLRKNRIAEIILEADLSNENTMQNVVELTENRLRGKQLDLVVAGPPCQGFSTAGNWNHDDPRNNLYKPLIQIVKRLLPRHVLIENVPGIRLMRGGEVLKKIEELLRETGYVVKTELLKAEEYGVPQKRRRIFILGSLKSEEGRFPPEPLFAASKEVRFGSNGQILFLPSPLTVYDAISDLPAVESGGGAEVMKYDDSWIRSDYQRWARGHIGFDELYKNISQRRNNVMESYLRQKEQVEPY
jgi:DNA (cytosine-5)-methyltransferase 1